MITHKQACFLRFVRNNEVTPDNVTFDWAPLSEAGLLNDRTELHSWMEFVLTPAGETALTEYDAAHVTLTKEQLGEVFKAGYEQGYEDCHYASYTGFDKPWVESGIWGNLQAEKS